tara:strand:- start:4050 stop:4379 length:330 start_codon:yes stop_codon:yes gene_type:complete
MTESVDNTNQEKLHGAYAHILSNGEYIINFTKADGSLREMHCTRDPKLIPLDNNELVIAEGVVARKPNYTALRVYEFGVGWRSFKVDNVTKLTNIELQNIVDEMLELKP